MEPSWDYAVIWCGSGESSSTYHSVEWHVEMSCLHFEYFAYGKNKIQNKRLSRIMKIFPICCIIRAKSFSASSIIRWPQPFTTRSALISNQWNESFLRCTCNMHPNQSNHTQTFTSPMTSMNERNDVCNDDDDKQNYRSRLIQFHFISRDSYFSSPKHFALRLNSNYSLRLHHQTSKPHSSMSRLNFRRRKSSSITSVSALDTYSV